MLEKIFLQILNMSFTASFVIILVLIARLFLKKSPKVLSYALWGVVLFRLICPFSFESMFSLLPVKSNPIPLDIVYEAIPTIDTGIPVINHTVNQSLSAATPAASINPLQIWTFIGSTVWLLGIAILLIYSIISLMKLQKYLKNAVHEKDNIYLAEHLDTPFVMGFIRPKIYLPTSLTEEEKRYILLHEQMHIKRFDHVIKLVSFFALCLHWFNPLVWIAFLISGKDMEMSCDEAVVKRLGIDVKKEYSSSLLTLATGRRIIGGSPLAFGEGDTKGRIKNVLNYKKPTLWFVFVALLAVVVLTIGFLSNPKTDKSFAMTGKQLSDLAPLQIVETIADMVNTDASELILTSDNFGLTVSADFNFVQDGAVRFLYNKDGKKYMASQLRTFVDKGEFFVTESTDWTAPKESILKLYTYLEALKYLPQDEIRALCKEQPQRYAIEFSANDSKYNESRQIYYNKDGVSKNNGWHIRLDIQPLYGDSESSFTGVGTDIIHVYYSTQDIAATSNPSEFLTHDQAIIAVLFSDRHGYLEGECFGEGHIILGTEEDSNATKLYALTMTGHYGFQNENFVKVSGTGVIPAVVTLSSNNDVSIAYPKDGSYYVSSIKEMFPSKYHNRIFDDRDSDRKVLTEQERAYAKEYLSKIGRKADIGDYSDFEHTSLTSLGVSVEVSNGLEDFYKAHSYYPYFKGTKEIIEDDVRMVYEMSYKESQQEIIFTKYSYGYKKVVEQFVFNSITGEQIAQ